MDEILKYVNDQNVRGDLARELNGVISDYQAGTINLQEKNELVESLVASFTMECLARDEEQLRWAVRVASIATSIV